MVQTHEPGALESPVVRVVLCVSHPFCRLVYYGQTKENALLSYRARAGSVFSTKVVFWANLKRQAQQRWLKNLPW